MITSEDKAIVKKIMLGTDLRVASEFYLKNTGRKISYQMLYTFISGKKPCDGHRQSSHQPVEMYRAICQAIQKRRQNDASQNNVAAEIRASTIEAPLAAAY